MRHFIQILSTLIAGLSFAPLAQAQTTPAPEPSPSQPSAAAKDNVEDMTQTVLNSPSPPTPTTAASTAPPSAPAAPVPPTTLGAASVQPSATTTITPIPPAPIAPSTEPPECTNKATRNGFYLRLASGLSFVSTTGDGPQGHAKISGLGSGVVIAIGGTIARGLVLAGTIQASSVTQTFTGGPFVGQSVTTNGQSKAASDKADAAFSEIGLLVDWYPNPSAGWHAGLSAGLGATSVMNHADNSTMAGTGLAGSVFGGYDWAIGSDWSLGLALVGAGAGSATMKDSSSHDDNGYRLKSFSLGLAGSILYF